MSICHYASCVRRKLAVYRCRGLLRQATRARRLGHRSMKRVWCCWSAPLGGLTGCHADFYLLFSTGTILPPLCRTWKGEIRVDGRRHLALIFWIHLPDSFSSIPIAVIFPNLLIRALSDHFLLLSSSLSSFARITPGLRN